MFPYRLMTLGATSICASNKYVHGNENNNGFDAMS